MNRFYEDNGRELKRFAGMDLETAAAELRTSGDAELAENTDDSHVLALCGVTMREDGRTTLPLETRKARAKAGAAARWSRSSAHAAWTVESVEDLKTILKRIDRRYWVITPDDSGQLRGTFTVGGRLAISGTWQLACAAR